MIRILAGVFQKDSGTILFDGEEPFENSSVKGLTLFIPAFPYFLPQATIKSMAKFCKNFYSSWSNKKHNEYLKIFKLNPKMQISYMSNGMQRQATLILGLECSRKYILLDEVFDGIDPLVRVALRK